MSDDTELLSELHRLRRRVAQLERGGAAEPAMLSAAEDLAQLGSFCWDAESQRGFWSNGLLGILQAEPDDVASIDAALLLVHPDDRKRLQRLSRLALRGGDIQTTHFRILRRDGTLLHVVGQMRASVDEAGRLLRLQGALMDVTERRSLEAQLLQAQKLEAVSTLAGGVAHDFNNFLQVIEGHIDLINFDPHVPQKTRFSVAEISAAVGRCRQLIERLLAFGRKQNSSPTLNDMRTLLGSTAQVLRRLLRDDVELVLASDPDPCTIRIDPVQFEQVLVNLATNARDAMPSGGTLEIRVERVLLGEPVSKPLGLPPGVYCRMLVRDTGEGMTEAVTSRVFEPFFTTKPKGTGTGLGLSTVHGIVHQAGGAITVDSAAGAGTCFTLLFPANSSQPAMQHVVVDSRDFPTGTETILLVEDGEEARSVTQSQLEQAGYRVIGASDGERALEDAAAHEGPIHLVLTDVMMPRMSGPELAGRLQEDHPAIPVVFMSGYTERFVFRRASLRSDRVSLHKPFSMRELLCCVREQLDATRKP